MPETGPMAKTGTRRWAGGTRRDQAGLTLVELMVALVIGLLVVAAVMAIYLSSSRNFAQDERFARMQENARYALKVLSEDLSLVSFWGGMLSVDTVTTDLAPGACGAPVQLFRADTPLYFNNNHSGTASSTFAPCTAVTDVQRGGTDVLAVKRVATTPGATTGVRLRTNGTQGSIKGSLINSTAALATGEQDWAYLPRLYFIGDGSCAGAAGPPGLCRMDLDHTSLDFGAPAMLAEGIEEFHVQFGIDSTGDGVADRYTSQPTLAEMPDAVWARVFVLARSSQPDPQYTNTKSFTLGDVNVPASGDNFYRQVYSTTVILRNSVNLATLNRG